MRRPDRMITERGESNMPYQVIPYHAVLEKMLRGTFYEVMGVSTIADAGKLKLAYRGHAMEYHPDRITDPDDKAVCEEIFKRVNEAYHTLIDPTQRARYDNTLSIREENRANRPRHKGFGYGRRKNDNTMPWRESKNGNMWRKVWVNGDEFNLVVMASNYGDTFGYMLFKNGKKVAQNWNLETEGVAMTEVDSLFD